MHFVVECNIHLVDVLNGTTRKNHLLSTKRETSCSIFTFIHSNLVAGAGAVILLMQSIIQRLDVLVMVLDSRFVANLKYIDPVEFVWLRMRMLEMQALVSSVGGHFADIASSLTNHWHYNEKRTLFAGRCHTPIICK